MRTRISRARSTCLLPGSTRSAAVDGSRTSTRKSSSTAPTPSATTPSRPLSACRRSATQTSATTRAERTSGRPEACRSSAPGGPTPRAAPPPPPPPRADPPPGGPPPATLDGVVICPNCGEENPERFRLCGFCGTPLAEPLPAQEGRKTVTIVFSYLEGSTALGEELGCEALREVMSRYFDEMRGALELHGGTIEKYI